MRLFLPVPASLFSPTRALFSGPPRTLRCTPCVILHSLRPGSGRSFILLQFTTKKIQTNITYIKFYIALGLISSANSTVIVGYTTLLVAIKYWLFRFSFYRQIILLEHLYTFASWTKRRLGYIYKVQQSSFSQVTLQVFTLSFYTSSNLSEFCRYLHTIPKVKSLVIINSIENK